jgi:hypothetical protein
MLPHSSSGLPRVHVHAWLTPDAAVHERKSHRALLSPPVDRHVCHLPLKCFRNRDGRLTTCCGTALRGPTCADSVTIWWLLVGSGHGMLGTSSGVTQVLNWDAKAATSAPGRSSGSWAPNHC